MIRYRNGAYEVVIHVGPDPITGKARRVSRTVRMTERKRTPPEVLAVEAKLRTEVAGGVHGGPKITVAEMLDAWFAHVEPELSPYTVRGYSNMIRLHLKPGLGAVRLDRLTAAHVDRFYRQMAGRGLSPATIRHAHSNLHRALTPAQRWGWVQANVTDLSDPPSVKRPSNEAPSWADIERLLAHASTDLADTIVLAAGTGLRRGELCALRWSDVDLEAGELVVRRSAVDIPGAAVSFKAPKSGKVRSVPIGTKLVERLRARLLTQRELAMRYGAPFTDGYVLAEQPGAQEALRPKLVTDRFLGLAKREKVDLRFHDLRHYAATTALAAGIPPNDVAESLGWSSTKMLFDTYSHAMPSGKRALGAALDVG